MVLQFAVIVRTNDRWLDDFLEATEQNSDLDNETRSAGFNWKSVLAPCSAQHLDQAGHRETRHDGQRSFQKGNVHMVDDNDNGSGLDHFDPEDNYIMHTDTYCTAS